MLALSAGGGHEVQRSVIVKQLLERGRRKEHVSKEPLTQAVRAVFAGSMGRSGECDC